MWWFPNNDRESTGSIGFGGNHAAHAGLRSSVSYLLIITHSFVIPGHFQAIPKSTLLLHLLLSAPRPHVGDIQKGYQCCTVTGSCRRSSVLVVSSSIHTLINMQVRILMLRISRVKIMFLDSGSLPCFDAFLLILPGYGQKLPFGADPYPVLLSCTRRRA